MRLTFESVLQTQPQVLVPPSQLERKKNWGKMTLLLAFQHVPVRMQHQVTSLDFLRFTRWGWKKGKQGNTWDRTQIFEWHAAILGLQALAFTRLGLERRGSA